MAGLFILALVTLAAPPAARAAGVVGTGIAASCTNAALDAALAGGGLVTFDCGPSPVSIDISIGTVGTKVISADTTIDGGGLITISGGGSLVGVGVFSVIPGVSFTVQNLTIANGYNFRGGGGIDNVLGTLTVTNSIFSGNRTLGDGGAIMSSGTLTITNSTFSSNSAQRGNDIVNRGGTLTGTNTITNSIFSGDRARSDGGSIFNFGALTVANSTFSGCRGYRSGGIYNGGTLTVASSTFSDNSGLAGGIFNDGTLTVTGSTFSDNAAFAGGILNVGTLTVGNSTFAGNSSRFGSILNYTGGSVLVTNSTFAGNWGGAVNNFFGTLAVSNTIIAGDPDGNCDGSIADGGHNIDDGASCGFTAADGSMSDTDPKIDAAGLQSNGGPTLTIALQPLSPAIDAGDITLCMAAPVDDIDQRGYARPAGGCSMGAYEYNAVVPATCAGDCEGNGSVAIDGLITLVTIALGDSQPVACPFGVPVGGGVDLVLIIQAINNALDGCGG